MQPTEHTFHTRHDFTPELGWAAFQLLAEFGATGTTLEGLEQTARALASPMSRRSDSRKLLRSLEEVGLLNRNVDKLFLSAAGQALAASAGRYESGFYSGVHCLYAWSWQWCSHPNLATPSWSYRRVCREIRNAGSLGIEPDAIVFKVTSAAEQFGADRVSFSRSSVNGVTAWLKVQSPPLIGQAGSRLHVFPHRRPGLTSVRYHVAALCSLYDGQADIAGENTELLADSLMISPREVRCVLDDLLQNSEEFHLYGGSTRQISCRGSSDPFLEWTVNGRHKDNKESKTGFTGTV